MKLSSLKSTKHISFNFAHQEIKEEKLQKNLWDFSSHIWNKIRKYHTIQTLYQAIEACYKEIRIEIETYRLFIETAKKTEALYQQIQELAFEVTEKGTYKIDASRLNLIGQGISGSYFLKDQDGKIVFVVKPIDEDIGCLHNSKGFCSPYVEEDFFRDGMTLYRSSLRETLTSEIAQMIGIESVAPKTVLGLLESEAFSFHFDKVAESEKKRYLEICGEIPREKLCSVQEFIPDSLTLFEMQQKLIVLGISDEEMIKRTDMVEFEKTNLLIWIAGDTDSHSSNILVYPKDTDELGNEIYGFKKIDSGLAYPKINGQLINDLESLPHAKQPLSNDSKAIIAALDEELLAVELKKFNLETSISAMKERVAALKQAALEDGITIQEVNQKIKNCGHIEKDALAV